MVDRFFFLNLFPFFISTDQKFLGAYRPEINTMESLFNQNSFAPDSPAPDTGGGGASSRRRRAVSNTGGVTVQGINNPTTCLRFNEAMLFGVDNDNYPVYDEKNLYNTNPNFDFGAFSDLAEQHQLIKTNSTLFAFRFTDPGVYVFKMNQESDQRMVSVHYYSLQFTDPKNVNASFT